MDYWDAIEYMLSLPDLERFPSGAGSRTMSLAAMKELLKRLGEPQLGRGTIHITGSKGKGSTSTMLASILHESGYKTALYTSPHLHDYVERIAIDLLPVSRFDFADAVTEMREAIDSVHQSELGPISTFGAMTALFFMLCRKQAVEWQVVEVGLGGRQDATNVFASKELAVITAISLEHTALLGNTCAQIAAEKAGIITPECSVVLATQQDSSVKKVVEDACTASGARFIDAERYRLTPSSHDSNGQSFFVQSEKNRYTLHTYMLGLHQLSNAVTAVAAAEALMPVAPQIKLETIEDGIANAEIAGRLEQLTRHPVTVVDGAHNRESMQALIDALERHFDYEECVFLLGVNQDKNIGEILEVISEIQPKMLIATRSHSQRAMDPERIVEEATRLKVPARASRTVADAIEIAREFADMNDLVCITGSLYVVAEAREKILALPVSR